MTDFQDHSDDRTASGPPPPARPPEVDSGSKGRLTPRRLLITFLVVLVAVAGGTLAANSLNDNSAVDQSMGSWMASYGSHYLDVSHDVATVNSSTDATSLQPACVKLRADVGRAESDPAMPLHSIESQWTVVLSNLSTAANDCVEGIDQQSATLLGTAQGHMTNAAKAYIDIAKAIVQVGN